MEATDLIAKSGAEGIFAAASPVEPGWGLALKISDGASRTVAPAVLAALAERGVRVLEEIEVGAVTDLHGEKVGSVAPLRHADLRDRSRREKPLENPE